MKKLEAELKELQVAYKQLQEFINRKPNTTQMRKCWTEVAKLRANSNAKNAKIKKLEAKATKR